ncbi:MAG: hypothetical protein F6J97_21460 [Leptolyngbya sp. SIO4C1]|nr:hypothetical protein [Leptolyngbya sp. SIO4C1]
MDRYLTHSFVALTWAEAVRLARLEGLPPDNIRHTPDVELLHRTDWWAWWSDEVLTMALGLPESVRSQELSSDAEALITDVWASESLAPTCGWQALAPVRRIVRQEPLSMSRLLSDYQIETRERLTVELQTGELSVRYQLWQSLPDGYLCDISFDLPATDS